MLVKCTYFTPHLTLHTAHYKPYNTTHSQPHTPRKMLQPRKSIALAVERS